MQSRKYLWFVLMLVVVLFSGCKVQINPTGEIVVRQDLDVLENRAGLYNFGDIPVGESTAEVVFTIENIGHTSIDLTGTPEVVAVSGEVSDYVINQNFVVTNLKPGETTDFAITFAPTYDGVRAIMISIDTTDEDATPYTFVVSGNGTKPDVNVRQGAKSILSGSGVYAFGEFEVGDSSAKIVFTIENLGSGMLQLTGSPLVLTVSGADASMFRIDQNSLDTQLFGGETTTFTITFMPTSDGFKRATISFANNDDDENPYTFSVLGAGMQRAEIVVIDPNSEEIQCNTGEVDFGISPVSETISGVFAIENIGNEDLLITGSPRVAIDESGTSAFSVTVQPSDKVSPGYNSTFTIEFAPTATANYSAIVTIMSNDSDENPFIFKILGKGVAPEINVKQGSTDIESGTGVYDFGSIKADEQSPEITFTIENLGEADLNLMGAHDLIEIVGADAGMFIINQTATSTPVKFGAPTTFTIIFAPTSDGAKSATISIPNNDSDEDPYEFTITGTGFYEPEINVTDIQRRDIPSGSGSYDFGTTAIGRSDFSIFFIENHGKAPLMLSNVPPVTISGSGASVFDVVAQPSSSIISPGSLRLFLIAFRPTARQEYSATVSIGNNDSDENPYTFTIKGKGGAPEINVKDSGAKDIPSGTGNFNFEAIEFDQTDDETFTIENLGEYILNITGNPRISITGPGASVFSVTADASPSVSAGLSTTFTIQFKPNGVDKFQATVSITNDDSDENPYTFKIFGRSKFKDTGLDFNGDGYEDIMVGAPANDTSGTNEGSVYIFYGSSSHSPTINAKDADVKIVGEESEDYFGFRVCTIGDFNKDGFDDIIVGVPENNKNGSRSGSAYIFFGSSTPLSLINASNANITIHGDSSGDLFGLSVSSAGDFNHDGYSDVVIGASDGGGVPWGPGHAYIIFGKSNSSSEFSASNSDIVMTGEASMDDFGMTVSTLGDFNNDGYSDVIVGALDASVNGQHVGRAYIFLGKQNPSSAISALNADIIINGENPGDAFAWVVSNAGDINNDGYEDAVIGAINSSKNGQNSGSIYIIFGMLNSAKTIDAANADIIITGEDLDDHFGENVTSIRDINNDGIDDIIVAAHKAKNNGVETGSTYIFYGRSNFPSLLNASDADVKIEGVDLKQSLGVSMASAGDFNRDGFIDVIIGTIYYSSAALVPGTVYVFYGKSNLNPNIKASDADIIITGENNEDYFGRTVGGGYK